MKIAFVSSYFEGPELDTITTSFYEELVKVQKDVGNEIVVISLTDGEPCDEERLGIRFVSLRFDRERYKPVESLDFAPALAWNLCRAVDLYRQGSAVAQAENVELIQCTKAIDAIGWLAYETLPVAVFSVTPQFEIMRLDFDRQYTPFDVELVTMLEIMSMSAAAVVASPSRELAQLIATTAGITDRLTEYLVPFAAADCNVEHAIGKTDDLRIAYAGGLERYKGVDLLIESLPILSRRVPEFHVNIAGESQQLMGQDSLAEVLKRRLTELGLSDRVTFFPPQDRTSRGNLFGTADVVVFPFRYCGCMSHVLEAMSDGAVIIATSVGSIRERLTHMSDAILVPPEDPAALARALEDVLLDSDLRNRLRSGARDYIAREYGSAQAGHGVFAVNEMALTRQSATANGAAKLVLARILSALQDFCAHNYVGGSLERTYTEGATRAWAEAYDIGRNEGLSQAQSPGFAELMQRWLHVGRR